MTHPKWFGTPHSDIGTPEKYSGAANDADLDNVFAGYEALDQLSNGSYREFLRKAARCTNCAADSTIPRSQQPINLLCGTGDDRKACHDAHTALGAYRRPGGSLCFNPNDGIEALAALLDERGVRGLSIGHCGWGDLTARLRGAQLGAGVDVMILC